MGFDWLPDLGFGASGIAGMYSAVTDAQAHDVLQTAWYEGIRYFDTAPHYGQGLSERRLGDFLRAFETDDYVLSTKVGRVLVPSSQRHHTLNGFVNPLPFDQVYDYSYDGIMRSVDASFQRLGLSKIDIIYVHDIGVVTHGDQNSHHMKVLLESGVKALEELRSSGTVKAVGLGVNETQICLELIPEMALDLIMLAGRYTLLDREAENGLLVQSEKNQIKLVAAGVFNSGILATGPGPHAHFNYEPATPEIQSKAAAIETMCRAHKVSLPSAAMNFARKHPAVVSTVIGTAKSSSLKRNLENWNAVIPDALWAELNKL